MSKKIIIVSNTDDVYVNLAVEEYCHRNLTEEYFIFYLWQSSSAVVIGKHQNPNNECNISLLRQARFRLARRVSGGGAVYHDLGNLNFSFICSRKEYGRDGNCAIIVRALAALGIFVERNDNYDLLYGDKKISGNAFYHTKHGVLHHGTLLVNSNLEMLSRALTPEGMQSEDHCVRSKRSAVINLSQIRNTLGIQNTTQALIREFRSTHEQRAPLMRWSDLLHKSDLDPYLEKQRSPDWIFGFPRPAARYRNNRVLMNA
ncbi:MAG: lipoate--protein ligase family protein [Spirochaetia bacterium]